MATTRRVEAVKFGGPWGMTKIPVTRTEVTCDCGAVTVIMDGMGERCNGCPQWYNMSGQKLNPPSQWGDETGERFSDSGQYIGGGED